VADSFILPALTPTPSNSTNSDDDLRRLFFRAFDSILDSDREPPVESVVLPFDDVPIVFSLCGNMVELCVRSQEEVTLKLGRRVRNIEQLKARHELKKSIRRMDEGIGQSLGRLVAIRDLWRLRGNVPDRIELGDYDLLRRQTEAYNARFIKACSTLHQLLALEPETGNEYHTWALSMDGVTAIFVPDLRPGKEGQYIETRFWFGRAATVHSTLNVPAADVSVVPDCMAPYQPFDVPAVWLDEHAERAPVWENPSAWAADTQN
jgi:hypothetical protein